MGLGWAPKGLGTCDQVVFTIMCLEWLTTYVCKPPAEKPWDILGWSDILIEDEKSIWNQFRKAELQESFRCFRRCFRPHALCPQFGVLLCEQILRCSAQQISSRSVGSWHDPPKDVKLFHAGAEQRPPGNDGHCRADYPGRVGGLLQLPSQRTSKVHPSTKSKFPK